MKPATKQLSQKERLARQNRTWVVIHVDIPVKKRLRVKARKSPLKSMDKYVENLIKVAVNK